MTSSHIARIDMTDNRKGRRVSAEKKAEAVDLHLKEHLSCKEISSLLNFSPSSVARWVRQARGETAVALPPPRRDGQHHDKHNLELQLQHLIKAVDAAEVRQGALQAHLKVLRSEIELLSHELSLALGGGAVKSGALPQTQIGKRTNSREYWKSLSRSQLGQDLWVLETLDWKRHGFFVDFGATDGVLLSNTWLLEKHFDWDGVCCEPNPKMFADLQANRSCKTYDDCIYRSTGVGMEFILADAYGGLSMHGQEDAHADKRRAYKSVGECLNVTTLSLMDLLDRAGAPREIDYLSLDTEGSELAILEGVDWGRYRIKCMTVEHNFTSHRESIARLLESRGYRRVEMKWDDGYILDP